MVERISYGHATPVPLTAGQSGIWYAYGLSGPNATFNAGAYLEIHGAVDVEVFDRAMRTVVTEAEALAVGFVENDQGPVQVLRPAAGEDRSPLDVIDVTGEPDPREAARLWMRTDAGTAVDVAADALFRFALIKAAEDC